MEKITRNWPDKRRGPWRITTHWDDVDGWLECVKVELDSLNPRKVTTSDIRAIPWATVLDEIRKANAEANRLRSRATLDAAAAAMVEVIEGQPPRPEVYGERARDWDKARAASEVAAVYRSGGSKPTKAVQKHFRVSPDVAAKMVQKARRLGLLKPTTPGKSGG